MNKCFNYYFLTNLIVNVFYEKTASKGRVIDLMLKTEKKDQKLHSIHLHQRELNNQEQHHQ